MHRMLRRRFLKTALATLPAAAVPWLPAQGADPMRPKLLGSAEPFDYARLKGLARTLSGSPYVATKRPLPEAVARLDWDHWQAIRFREEHTLWAGEGLRFGVRFAHLGFRLDKAVRMYVVEQGRAQELAYDPAMFDYQNAGLRPGALPANLGFGGFRLHFHTDFARDRAAFQGASYFRAVDSGMQFGMSQRGLAIDCGLPTPEEFPDFIAYYIERPARDSNQITVYGLLDSPSVTGAYRFLIDIGESAVMDVDAALYPRREINRMGIAVGTSMFFVGKNDRSVSEDWRPEIHDSDGLQLFTGSGEWIWRPLVNPAAVRVNSYVDDNPRGFGLMQRERDFTQYQDDGVFYDRRPSAWIEPRGHWGRGAVMLVEIPTRDETSDNIVAFWNPADKPQRGQELLYAYRLTWCRDNPLPVQLATTRATRSGIGGIVGRKRTHFSRRFVVDFGGGALTSLAEHAAVVPVITASRGRVEITSARPLIPLGQWRAMFDLVPPDDSIEPINLRMYLALDGEPLTETWLYQYTPPPPAERRF